MSQLNTYFREKALRMHLTVLVQALQWLEGLWTGSVPGILRNAREVLLSPVTVLLSLWLQPARARQGE